MATTTNYGWTTPDDTSLVKDGASAIRTLGSAIDTSLNTALGTKKAGLVLLNTTSFSGVTTQSINDVFSSTYENYRIVLRFSSSTGAVSMRMRVSGTDTSSSDYTYIRGSANSDTGPTWALTQSLSATSWASLNASDNASTSGYIFDMFAPNLAQNTTFNAQTNGTESSVPIRVYTAVYSGVLRLTTQYTGFTIIGATALGLTGKVSVYGYNI